GGRGTVPWDGAGRVEDLDAAGTDAPAVGAVGLATWDPHETSSTAAAAAMRRCPRPFVRVGLTTPPAQSLSTPLVQPEGLAGLLHVRAEGLGHAIESAARGEDLPRPADVLQEHLLAALELDAWWRRSAGDRPDSRVSVPTVRDFHGCPVQPLGGGTSRNHGREQQIGVAQCSGRSQG